MNYKTYLKLLLLTLIISSCETVKNDKSILNEDFNSNEIGWVEENTSFHYLDIVDGYYRIQCKDSAVQRTSTGSLAGSYLINLPEEYSIKSSMKLVESKNEETHYGIILSSASLDYGISVYASGWVLFTEYDYNIDSIYTVCKKYIKLTSNNFSKVEMEINQRNFKLKVNDTEIGQGQFKTETNNWRDLRLYTSKASSIVVDDLKIEN